MAYILRLILLACVAFFSAQSNAGTLYENCKGQGYDYGDLKTSLLPAGSYWAYYDEFFLEVNKNWTKIKMHYDGYEGWMDTKQIQLVTDEFLANRKTNAAANIIPNVINENIFMLLLSESDIILISFNIFFSVLSVLSHSLPYDTFTNTK